MKYVELLKESSKVLAESGNEFPDTDAWYLMEYVFEMNRSSYFLHMNDAVNPEGKERYQQLIEKRAKHVPLQHLTGSQQFMGYDFQVNEHVLIPRQDTEVLVEECEKHFPSDIETGLSDLDRSYQLLDMCTGSGCIAISLKLRHPKLQVTASDLSDQALQVAMANSKELEADVDFVHSDLFTNLTGRYDMIVSNPPYIPTAEIDKLMPEVRLHEPMSALDGTEDGLFFYEKITEQAREYLTDKGWLFYEIGYDQGQAVADILSQNGFLDVQVVKDLAGLDRVVYGHL